jgi:hypothetical protein
MKADTLRPELKNKIVEWILSFYHLDPRYKILTFFNQCAREGADNLTDDSQDDANANRSSSDGSIKSSTTDSLNGTSEHHRNANLMMSQTGRSSARNMKNIRPSTIALLKNVFNATSILTVWRPCSNDAMRKMMEGAGVGKGLDIKGKSAKRGTLSAFVPFMQIFKEEHKNDMQPISVSANMRIYYKHEKLRDYVYSILEDFLENGPKRKKKKKKKCRKKKKKNGVKTNTAETTKIQELQGGVPEIVSVIEANNDLRLSQKKALEDAAAELFCPEENEASCTDAATATATATATVDTATDKNPQDEEKEHQEMDGHVIDCSGGGFIHTTSLQTEPGAIRASTNGEEKVDAVVIAAEKAATAAATAAAEEEEEAAANAKAHAAAAYENPYGADDDDVTTDDDADMLINTDDDDDEDDSDDDDNESEEDGIYVGNYHHTDKNSQRYTPSKPLKKIKKFVKTGYYGIECSQRLFWYATVADASIERKGTGTETGRPSLPGFQDANMKTLKVAQSQIPKPSPMPVVLQQQSYEDCMNKKNCSGGDGDGDESSVDDLSYNPLDVCLDPLYLVMAYEEQGSIKPVVSDFDGFLLGWRREALWFGCNLPRDQEKLMMWCVDHVEEVLEEQKRNPTNGDTWTIRWLDILKKEAARGFQIEMPEYGFGDPKSTSIMEHAANKLKSTGAVRHGSECFNYQFPQEIDDMFLLISDTLKPVPWKYVKVEELQEILLKRIKESFVFPLNPKWILCDPGWKQVYDELIASRTLYATMSTDVWFPAHTKVRDRIEEIYKNHPEGFQRCTDPAKARSGGDASKNISPLDRRNSATNILRGTLDDGLGDALTGNAAADLAQLELDDFVVHSSNVVGANNAGSKGFAQAMKTARESISIDDLKDDCEGNSGVSCSYSCSVKSANASNSMKHSSTSSQFTTSSSKSNNNSDNKKKGISWKDSSGKQQKRGSGVSHCSSIASVNSSVNSNTSNSNATTNTKDSRSFSGSNHTPRGIRQVFKASKRFFGGHRNRGSCSTHSEPADAHGIHGIQPADLSHSASDQAHNTIHGGNASTTSSINTNSDEIKGNVLRNFSGSLHRKNKAPPSPKK